VAEVRRRRDELGRFKSARRRDRSGKFLPDAAPRKKSAPRPAPKKPAPRPAPRPAPKKPAPRPVSKKPAPRPVSKKPAPRPVSKKPAPRPVSKKPAPRPAPKKPAPRPAPKKPAPRLVPKKPAPRPVPKKPAPRPVPKKLAPRPAPKKPAPRPVPKKPAPRPAPKKPAPRPVPKKPERQKPVPKKPERQKPVRKKPERPRVPEGSALAEAEVQAKLVELQGLLELLQPGLDTAVQSMINYDGTVDGELRIGDLPAEWREAEGVPLLIATLSSAFRSWRPFAAQPVHGGAYWVSFGVRFGPQNESEIGELAELYKRFRGLFQIGTYPAPAWNTGPIQIVLTSDRAGLRSMVQTLLEKRGLPPTNILVRFVWTTDRQRPGHYRGEK
jgi:hypothetical protein